MFVVCSLSHAADNLSARSTPDLREERRVRNCAARKRLALRAKRTPPNPIIIVITLIIKLNITISKVTLILIVIVIIILLIIIIITIMKLIGPPQQTQVGQGPDGGRATRQGER